MQETSLWAHQIDGIQRATQRIESGDNNLALFMDPGVGKSRTMLEILKVIYTKHKMVIPTVIFCPPVVIPNWKNEILKYTKITEDKIVMVTGTQVQRAKIVKESHAASIFITNYESLLMTELMNELEKLSQYKNVLILDESHKCKSSDSKRTKAMIKLSDKFDYKYLLTGTPILNELWDIWSQYRIMDKGKTFGVSFWAFRATYYRNLMAHVPNSKFPKYVAIPGSDDTVKRLIADSSITASKNDCLTLPPLVQKTIEVEMSSEQKRLYTEMKKDMITTITNNKGDTKVSISQLAITKSLRMLQILSGHIPVQDDETNEQTVIKIKNNPRKEALKDILEDLAPAHKVIVWAVFKDNYADIEDVCKKLDLGYVFLTGETKDKQVSMEAFNNDPKIRVLIGNPKAGGIGVNLIASSYSVYYSRSYSLEDDIQSQARNYRSGSEIHKSITRIDLVCKHTLDALVLDCLASKQQLSDKILKERINEI